MQRFASVVSLVLASLLALSLFAPVQADDDNKKKTDPSNEVDCNDRDNAALPECQSAAPPVVESQEQVTSTTTETPTQSAPSQARSGPVLFTGSPMDILFTLPDAGKEAVQYRFEEGADARSRWARIRFERRSDTGSQDTLGPRVIDHTVHITGTVDQARQLFKDEADKNERFPEQNARDARRGSFKWDLENLVELTAALSACNDCGGNEQLMLHHRIVQNRNNVVSIVYLYGREARGKDEITSQKASELWARKVAERI